jgi:tripartite-type tricarboxylate transporter receptor subunit TctC
MMNWKKGRPALPNRAAAAAAAAIAAAALAALLAAIAALAVPANAAWPDHTIRLVVPFAPGGASDLIARMIAPPLGEALKQSVVVENHAGANGNIGITMVAHADPDGYTLLVASSVFLVNPTLSKSAAYDPQSDFAAIAELGGSPNAIVTRPASGIADIADLMARAKAKPNSITFSSPGLGSISQLGLELLELRTGVKLLHVPFTGAGPAVQAALAGTTDLAAVNISAVMPHIKAGTLKALAQTGRTRWFELADVPTLEESGVANSVSETFQALLAPARTPSDITGRIERAVIEILTTPEMGSRLKTAGFAGAGEGAQKLSARIADEVAMWKDVIGRAGLKID